MIVYVKNSKKIYLKTNQSKLGHIKVIDPENLTVEKIINLNIPEKAKTKSVSDIMTKDCAEELIKRKIEELNTNS